MLTWMNKLHPPKYICILPMHSRKTYRRSAGGSGTRLSD